MSANIDRESPAYDAGFSMGYRHAHTGDPDDWSDARCNPLETERDSAAKSFPHSGPFGNGTFHIGYEEGYEAALTKLNSKPYLPRDPYEKFC